MLPFNLTKAQRAVGNVALKEESQSTLCCVELRSGRITATDGHMLVSRSVPDYTNEETLLLRADDVLTCKDIKGTGDGVVIMPGADKGVVHGVVDGGVRDIRVVSGNFPDYATVTPKSEPVARVALSVSLLKRLLKCIDDKNGENVLHLFLFGEERPVVFSAGAIDTGVSGAIMPSRVNWDTACEIADLPNAVVSQAETDA